jgi:exodeoxyribonuclease VII large subunit
MAGMEQAALFDVERTWRVGELTQRINRALASAFPTEIWLKGEIDGLREPNRNGHQYFSLCERNNRRGPVSTIPMALLDQSRRRIDRELAAWPDFRLRNGLEVRVRAKVQFGYGNLSLLVSQIDPAHTMGALAADRERVRAALVAEGLLEAQRRLPLSVAPLHIGIVTSDGSAACEDVLSELRGAGLGFRVSLADAQMQGGGADLSIVRAFVRLLDVRPDVVLLVRGGGARTDLATFDGERLARAIAKYPIPVLAGIGHEIDTSVADECAHATFKTPTATAAFVVERVRAALARAERAWGGIAGAAMADLAAADERVAARATRLASMATTACDRATERLDGRAVRVGSLARGRLALASSRLDVLTAQVDAADPARLLARGWSMTRRSDGALVRAVDDAPAGTTLVTTVADGTIESVVAS